MAFDTLIESLGVVQMSNEPDQNKRYFVIDCSGDEPYFKEIGSKEELIRYIEDRPDAGVLTDLSAVGSDMNYWGNKILVIEGRVVNVKLKKTFEVEIE